MSLRLDMLQAARSAPNLLRDAGDGVIEFLRGQFNDDGGAKGRTGESDLYYTVFALDGLAAMGVEAPVEATLSYLRRFGDGEGLDFVHRACLARCWAGMPVGSLDGDTARRILHQIEAHRSHDGGYGPAPGSSGGTTYQGFLAVGAYQDLGAELPNPRGLARCVAGLQADDGGFANEGGLKHGTTPATAAAAVLMRELDLPVPPTVGDWLLARHYRRGGFLAMPGAPMPDLLSTATALYALACLSIATDTLRETCRQFVDSLWTGRAFRGHWADEVEDCEYTYYGLLALGHLSS
jgi:prenyltransferase beta subunit